LQAWKGYIEDTRRLDDTRRTTYPVSQARNAIIASIHMPGFKMLGDQCVLALGNDRMAKVSFLNSERDVLVMAVTIYSKVGGEVASNVFRVPIISPSNSGYCYDGDRRAIGATVVKRLSEIAEYIDLHR
jgi:hypothetical protein